VFDLTGILRDWRDCDERPVRLSTHLFLTNRSPWHSESRLADNSDIQGRREGSFKVSVDGEFVYLYSSCKNRSSLSSFPSYFSSSSDPPRISSVFFTSLLLQPSRRENKAPRYKYFALCIISIELSGPSRSGRNYPVIQIDDDFTGTILVPLEYKDLHHRKQSR